MLWFTADPHYGHDKIISLTRKCFVDTKQHDDHLIDVCNSHVKRHDTLVIVGDFGMDKPGKYRSRIKCSNTFFILGNHDKEHKIRAVFGGNVWTQRLVKLPDGVRVLCAHHPQSFWDGCHKGWFHAYGHIHFCPKREAMMDLGMPGRRSMDVGVDAAKQILGDYRPFSQEEFLTYLSTEPGHDTIKPHEKWNYVPPPTPFESYAQGSYDYLLNSPTVATPRPFVDNTGDDGGY